MTPPAVYSQMSPRELYETITAAAALRDAADRIESAASHMDMPQSQAWAGKYIDQLQDDLREAAIEYWRRDLSDVDEKRDRELAIVAAWIWLRDNPFDLTVNISMKAGS